MKKKWLVGIGVFAGLLGLSYFGVGNYFYNFALSANDEKEFLDGNPHLEESEAVMAELAEAAEEADKQFKVEHPPASLSIVSDDEPTLELYGDVYINDEPTSKWAIVTHGYTGNAASMTRYVRNFYDQGFNVLAPDLRGHGNSEGDYIGMGWHDRLDMLKWVDEIIEVDSDAEIVLFGVSMGAATVMMTSGEELPPNVKVVIEDCGYSSVSGVFIYQLKDLFGLPEFPVMQAANTMTNIRAGYDLYEASAVDQIQKSKLPTLFIHGDEDTFVPYEMLDEVYNATSTEKEKLVIEGAGHGEAEKVNPELYWNTIWGFLEKYM